MNDPVDYLNHISNSDIEVHALKYLYKIKKDITNAFGNNYGLNEDQSITDMIFRLIESDVGDKRIDQVIPMPYLVAIDMFIELNNRNTIKEKHKFHINGLCRYTLISNQIWNTGIGVAWNSLPIKSESARANFLNGALKNKLQRKESSWANQTIDDKDMLLYVLINHAKVSNRHDNKQITINQFLPMFNKSILFENDKDYARYQTSKMLSKIAKSDRHNALLMWVAPLVQTAYIQGANSPDIIKGALPIIETLIDETSEYLNHEERSELVRRSLIYISMGFDGLIKELKPTKEDMLRTGNGGGNNTFNILSNSPLSNLDSKSSLLNQNEDIYRSYKKSLDYAGFDLDLDIAISIDSTATSFEGIMLSGLHLSQSSAPLIEAERLIASPPWVQRNRQMFQFSRSLDLETKMLLSLSILEKEPYKDLLALYFPDYRYKSKESLFTNEEKVLLLDKLISDNKISSEIAGCLEIGDKHLRARMRDLPARMRRELFSDDLGL